MSDSDFMFKINQILKEFNNDLVYIRSRQDELLKLFNYKRPVGPKLTDRKDKDANSH